MIKLVSPVIQQSLPVFNGTLEALEADDVQYILRRIQVGERLGLRRLEFISGDRYDAEVIKVDSTTIAIEAFGHGPGAYWAITLDDLESIQVL